MDLMNAIEPELTLGSNKPANYLNTEKNKKKKNKENNKNDNNNKNDSHTDSVLCLSLN
jgi:hypothetical protein